MDFSSVFQNKAEKKTWVRIDDDRVIGAQSGAVIEKDQAYVIVRMNEMYLQNTRKLWRKFYPMLHGYAEYQGEESHAVAGPGQMREVSETHLDRIMTFNFRLAGPIAYQGGDLTVLAGLYSVPGGDAGKALVDTLAQLAGLAGLAIGNIGQIVGLVKSGIENVLGLDESRLEIAVRDTFYPNNPLKSGFHVGIDAGQDEIDISKLWLNKGRLVKGLHAGAAEPYCDHDYMVIEVERRDSLNDWASLPELGAFELRFNDIIANRDLDLNQKKKALNGLYAEFTNAVNTSKDLITDDKKQIVASVGNDIVVRLKAPPLFPSGLETAALQPEEFDFTDVPDVLNLRDSVQMARAKELLEGGKLF